MVVTKPIRSVYVSQFPSYTTTLSTNNNNSKNYNYVVNAIAKRHLFSCCRANEMMLGNFVAHFLEGIESMVKFYQHDKLSIRNFTWAHE